MWKNAKLPEALRRQRSPERLRRQRSPGTLRRYDRSRSTPKVARLFRGWLDWSGADCTSDVTHGLGRPSEKMGRCGLCVASQDTHSVQGTTPEALRRSNAPARITELNLVLYKLPNDRM